MRTIACCSLLLSLAACGDDVPPPPPPDMLVLPDLSAPPYVAMPGVQPPSPPMLSSGGPTIAAMHVFTIVWKGDEAVGKQLDDFHTAIFADDYWKTTTSEYGVGPGTAAGVIVVPGSRPSVLTTSTLQTIVEAWAQNGTLAKVDSNTVLDFIIPTDVTSFDGQSVGNLCKIFGGYHTEFQTSPSIPYIINPQCNGSGLAPLDELTSVDSHELIETATDPHPFSNIGWQNPWLAGYGEVGDMCQFVDLPITVKAADGTMVTYLVSHAYSAKIANSGKGDPCVPSKSPFYDVGVVPANVVVNLGANGVGTTTIQLVPFTDGTPVPLEWSAFSLVPGVTLSPSGGAAKPNQIINVKVTARGQGGGTYPGELVILVNDPTKVGVPGQQWIAALTVN